MSWTVRTGGQINRIVGIKCLPLRHIVIQLLSLVCSCSTNLVGCPCSNVANSLVWRFSTRRLITFQPFLWITSQFHHGILEPPMKINLCHCQFVLMLLNIHFFLEPLPIGIPFHWLFASRSRFSLSMEVCWARHPPVIADHHDTPAVTGGLHPLLDTSPKNRVKKRAAVKEFRPFRTQYTAASNAVFTSGRNRRH